MALFRYNSINNIGESLNLMIKRDWTHWERKLSQLFFKTLAEGIKDLLKTKSMSNLN